MEDDPNGGDELASATIISPENEKELIEIEEPEEDPFVKVEMATGLQRLKEAQETGQINEIRSAYTSLTKSFPTANLIWYSWAQMEYINGSFDELEGLFTRCLKNNLSVPLWKLYLSYVRKHQLPQIMDESEARQTMLKAYDFAVGHIGLDVASGSIWSEYLEYSQSNYYKLLNEQISNWEQQQLMDLIRKIYHRALLNPMEGLENLWHSYDSFENGLNKLTAKKLMAEKSSGYMAARSATKELVELISRIDLDGEFEDQENISFAHWMDWINWERRNPLILANKPLLHSRIVYAFRRALMTMRGEEKMWLEYANYLRFEVNKFDDAEVVLKQACRSCEHSLPLLLALTDLRESRGVDLEAISGVLNEYIGSTESSMNSLKVAIIEECRGPGNEEEEVIFDRALVERTPEGPVQKYLKLQGAFNGAQVRLLELSRRLSGLGAARSVFATARKSVHVSSKVFSAAAMLEFRIRKDPSICAKIYELALNRFPTDWPLALEYLKFLLSQNDDGNIRSLFERIVASVEGFRSTHSRETIELNESGSILKDIWSAFLEFEGQVGDYQSVRKLEERMRAAFPDEPKFKPEAFFAARLQNSNNETSCDLELSSKRSDLNFSLPKIREGSKLAPFHLSEGLFDLLLRINDQIATFDGPGIDVSRFISFIERVALPNEKKQQQQQHTTDNYQSSRPTSNRTQQRSTRRRREDDEDDRRDRQQTSKQSRSSATSSIFEDRRRN